MHTFQWLKVGLVYLYGAFQFNVINDPLHIESIHHKLNNLLLHIKSTFTFQTECQQNVFHP